jgi:ribose transport system permease protein
MMVYMKLDPWLAILIGILAAVGIGASNGLIVTRIGIPAFITTLATMNICTGLADLVTFTKTIAQLPDAVGVLGRGYVFDFIPVSVLIMFGLYILMAFVFSKTRLGRNMYAIGGNPEAAFFAGINTKKYYMIAFMMSGLFAGISASILLSRLNSAGVGSGYLYEFEALIGCVLGGVAFSGGKGKIIGVLLGVMFSVILFNGMTILNIHSFVQFIFKGVVLVAAMSFDVIRNRKRA